MEKTSRGRDEVPIKYNGYSRIILVATWKEEQRGVTSNWSGALLEPHSPCMRLRDRITAATREDRVRTLSNSIAEERSEDPPREHALTSVFVEEIGECLTQRDELDNGGRFED